jgi:Tfp pilus assembly protein PilO
MRLSEREMRTIGVGVAIAISIVAFWLVSSRGDRDASAGDPTGAELYARLHQLAAQRETTERALAEAKAQETLLHQRLLSAGEPAVAGAELSSLVEQVAMESGVRLDQRRIGEASTVDDALSAIPLEIMLSGDILGLRLFLYSLARTGKTLNVDNLVVASLAAGTTVGARPSDAPPLRVQMTVTGYAGLPGGAR